MGASRGCSGRASALDRQRRELAGAARFPLTRGAGPGRRRWGGPKRPGPAPLLPDSGAPFGSLRAPSLRPLAPSLYKPPPARSNCDNPSDEANRNTHSRRLKKAKHDQTHQAASCRPERTASEPLTSLDSACVVGRAGPGARTSSQAPQTAQTDQTSCSWE